MITVSVQEIRGSAVRTLLAVREERTVEAILHLIAERLHQLTEQEPPEWFKLVEGEDDAD